MTKQTALITGGASGIGRIVAGRLAQQGYSIAVTYKNSRKAAEGLASELKLKYGIKALAIKSDAASEKDCKEACRQVVERFGRVDALIYNAGPYIHERKSMTDYTSEEWHYLINGNLNGFFYMAKEILPQMRKDGGGRIITVGFEKAETAPGWIYRSAFAAAKTALTSLTRTLALEEASHGITVNMVCPGDIVGQWKESTMEEARHAVDSSVPAGRPGTGEDIARVVAFLCSADSDFITGSVIPVTGGKDVLHKAFRDQ